MKVFTKDEVVRYYLIFFLLACAITWVTAFLRPALNTTGPTDWIINRIVKFGPSLAGLIMIVKLYGLDGIKSLLENLTRLRVSWRWYLFALAPLPILGISVFLFSNAASLDAEQQWWYVLLFNANTGMLTYFFTRGGLGEEVGWRGFAIPLLKAHFSLFKISLLVGFTWALWHLPAMLTNGLLFFLGYTLLVVCLSFIFTYLFEKTRHSLFFVILLHATFNASDNMWELLLIGEDESGNWKLPLYVIMVIAAIIVAIRFYKEQNGTIEKAPPGTEEE